MSFGYVYVMSNPSMPGLLKIGYTERPIEERLQEANQGNTWIPMPFSLELSKFVNEPQKKEMTIHKILDAHRVNPKREFFNTDMEQVKILFDLMDTCAHPEPETDETTRMLGTEVLHLFLDTFVYPPDLAGTEPVQWPKVQALFQTWKREHGYVAGNAMKLREMIIEAYGKPTRGEGWTTFTLRV
jgi:hypothetical protein